MSCIIVDKVKAVDLLQSGEIVAIPTETVYGLAASALNEHAIERVFILKKRPHNHPLIMHIAPDWDLKQWVSFIPDYVKDLIAAYWPGPLTFILPLKKGVLSPRITGGQNTIAIRAPSHPVAIDILHLSGLPLVAPSANPFGHISPTTAQHVQQSFPHDPLYILDGGRCSLGIESTLIDATHPSHYRILRHGHINEQALQSVAPYHQTDHQTPSTLRAPGQLARHYQPKKPLYCFTSKKKLQVFCSKNPSAYILSFSKTNDFPSHQGYELPETPDALAFELYYQLRHADDANCDIIAMELPPDTSLFSGVRERLLKAGVWDPSDGANKLPIDF